MTEDRVDVDLFPEEGKGAEALASHVHTSHDIWFDPPVANSGR